MKKIREFIANHKKAVFIFYDIMIIIFGFYLIVCEILGGFTAEQLDENSVLFCILVFFISEAFFNIFDILFSKPKSNKD